MGRVVVIADRERADATRRALEAAGIAADVFVPESEDPEEAIAEYREKMQRLAVAGMLAAGVAHDVANVVTVLLAQLGEGGDPSANAAEIRAGLDRLWGIARGLTTFARAPRERTLCDLSEIADEATTLVEASLNGAIAVERDFAPPHTARLQANHVRLLQVALNLLLNAGQALGSQPDGWLLVQTTASDRHVSLCVADNGPGMTAEQQAAAFDPFVTTRTSGSGLGLYVCQHVVASYQGDISIDSRAGEGTRVVVRLPRA
ncbi:MAG TPA: HAMP domain-containing sensor histidine kinase [Kofleriaceae bacterium]|nr:HAMP domain-containing sensor histidine kinase [Kofleriaceae bacterium]